MASSAISVIIGSYRRPDSLRRCLDALAGQTMSPLEVIVVLRSDDQETLAVCTAAMRDFSGLATILVDRPGAVAALNAGLSVARGSLVAITDDDARPYQDWLEQITAVFDSDPRIGALGGPDLIAGSRREPAPSGRVGRITWYGRIYGNHDAGTRREDIDTLKGVNMAFRRSALRGFNERLRGNGAQVGLDMDVALAAQRRGYRVVFEPKVRVRHYPAPRPANDPRRHRSLKILRDQVYNENHIVMSTMRLDRAIICTLYGLLVGYRSAPGLAHLGLALLKGPARGRALVAWAAVLLGRTEGLATGLLVRRSGDGR